MRRLLSVILLVTILFGISAGTSLGSQRRARSGTASRKSHAVALGTVAQFKAAFQNDEGRIRLVALISPT